MAEATLDELRAARDEIIVGRRTVTVSSGGRSITCGPADLEALERRIRELEAAEGKKPVSVAVVRQSKNGWS